VYIAIDVLGDAAIVFDVMEGEMTVPYLDVVGNMPAEAGIAGAMDPVDVSLVGMVVVLGGRVTVTALLVIAVVLTMLVARAVEGGAGGVRFSELIDCDARVVLLARLVFPVLIPLLLVLVTEELDVGGADWGIVDCNVVVVLIAWLVSAVLLSLVLTLAVVRVEDGVTFS